jgi:hypothetical protein
MVRTYGGRHRLEHLAATKHVTPENRSPIKPNSAAGIENEECKGGSSQLDPIQTIRNTHTATEIAGTGRKT